MESQGGSGDAPELRFYENLSRADLRTELEEKRWEIKRGGVLLYVVREIESRLTARPAELIVEVGGGLGSNLLLLRESVAAKRLVSVDLVDPLNKIDGIEYVRARADYLHGAISARSADAVLMVELISHLFDTDTAIEEVRAILKDGGLLLVTTPNLSSMVNRIALLLGYMPLGAEVSTQRVFGRPGARVVGIIRLFTPKALSEFLEYHGFGIQAIYSVAEDFQGSQYSPFRSTHPYLTRLLALGESLATHLNRLWGFRILVVATKRTPS